MRGKWIKKLFLVIFIIAIFAAIAMTNGKVRKTTLVESVFSKIILLPEKMYVYAKNQITSNDIFFADIENLKQENKELKIKIEEAQKSAIGYDELYAENQTLKRHINLADNYPDHKVIVADIVTSSLGAWEATYQINAGENQGVKPRNGSDCRRWIGWSNRFGNE